MALVAIVLGGLIFMYGEGGAKRQMSGIVFGVRADAVGRGQQPYSEPRQQGMKPLAHRRLRHDRKLVVRAGERRLLER
jgi:hypothetical protein